MNKVESLNLQPWWRKSWPERHPACPHTFTSVTCLPPIPEYTESNSQHTFKRVISTLVQFTRSGLSGEVLRCNAEKLRWSSQCSPHRSRRIQSHLIPNMEKEWPQAAYRLGPTDMKTAFEVSTDSTTGLAISGGVDSMALASLCSRFNSPDSISPAFSAFIVDHGVRKGSTEEAENVAELLRRLSTFIGIPIILSTPLTESRNRAAYSQAGLERLPGSRQVEEFRIDCPKDALPVIGSRMLEPWYPVVITRSSWGRSSRECSVSAHLRIPRPRASRCQDGKRHP